MDQKTAMEKPAQTLQEMDGFNRGPALCGKDEENKKMTGISGIGYTFGDWSMLCCGRTGLPA